MTKSFAPDELIRTETELLQVGMKVQEQGLDLLLAEMRALAMLIPGAETHHPTEAEIEASFDNMPV